MGLSLWISCLIALFEAAKGERVVCGHENLSILGGRTDNRSTAGCHKGPQSRLLEGGMDRPGTHMSPRPAC